MANSHGRIITPQCSQPATGLTRRGATVEQIDNLGAQKSIVIEFARLWTSKTPAAGLISVIGIVDTIDAVACDFTTDSGLTTTDYLGDTP
ncbi:TPA: hypothetical protein ACF4TF_001826, partial [Streptococcus pyogenes]